MLPPAVELRFNVVASRPVITAAATSSAVAVYTDEGDSLVRHDSVAEKLLAQAVDVAWPERKMTARGKISSSDFYPRSEELGANTWLFSSQQGTQLDVYVNGDTGRIAAVMDGSRRTYAWLYYALHTWRVHGLYEQDTLRIVLVLFLMGVGFAFSVTGVVIGFKRLFRTRPAVG